MIKKSFFSISIFLLSSLVFAAREKPPSWLKNPEREYPSDKFIRGEGDGNSIKAAQNAALIQISLYFNTQTEIMTTAVNELQQIVKDENTSFESRKSMKQVGSIKSEADFFCVNFTDAYYDKKNDKYSVLAYINKKEAADIYTMRINSLLEAIASYRNYAKTENEPFLAVTSMHKAEVLAKICSHYIQNETTIVPSDSGKYEDALKMVSLVSAERNAMKKDITFSISMNQNDKRFDPIFSATSAVLEKYGYAYSLRNSTYKIIIDISCAEEHYSNGDYVRASLDVLILNNSGEGVYTYSKAFPRIGRKTMEMTYTSVVSKIKQDLEENFLTE